MKKVISILLFSTFCLLIFMAFKPKVENNRNVVFPFGAATQTSVSIGADSTASATVWNTMTLLNLDTLTNQTTLNLTIERGTRVGSTLVIKAISGATAKTLVAGTGLQFPNVSGSSNKTKNVTCVYNGSKFVVTGVELIN